MKHFKILLVLILFIASCKKENTYAKLSFSSEDRKWFTYQIGQSIKFKNSLRILFGLLLTGILFACKKTISSNISTTVKGFVIDTVKNKRLPNATVIINGCDQANFRTYCIDSLTSTKTNANGEFEITFQSNGTSIGFEATVSTDENYDYSTFQTLEPGKTNTISLKAREKNYLKANINVTNNPLEPLVVLSIGTKHVIYSRNVDTLLWFRVLPGAQNLIIFSAWDRSAGGYRQLIDTLQINMQDTTYYRKVLPDVQSFPLR
jgi:hypothetical protein